MPELTTLTVKAGTLAKGDLLQHNGDEVEVVAIRKGTVNVAITYRTFTNVEKQTTKRTDAEVTIQRSEKTAQEKRDLEVATILRVIMNKMITTSDGKVFAQQKLDDAQSVADFVKWHAEDAVKMETIGRIWDEVKYCFVKMVKDDEMLDDIDLPMELVGRAQYEENAERFFDAFCEVWDEEFNGLLNYPGDTYSGRLTNDMIRVQLDAKRDWVRDMQYNVNWLRSGKFFADTAQANS